MNKIKITCPICGCGYEIPIPRGVAGGDVRCECGQIITFIEKLELIRE